MATLPPAMRDDPGLMLDRARAFRREDRPTDALAVWIKDGANAENAAPDHVGEFWAERNVLARKLLQDGGRTGGSYEQTYQLVADHGQIAGESLLDAEFLAGFIALRLLHDPARAAPHFKALAAASPAAITQGRAHYWLARTAAAEGADPKPEYARAAAWTTTFYGQIAALAIGGNAGGTTGTAAAQAALLARIGSLKDPHMDPGAPLWPSPDMRWCAPPPGWWHGATANGPAASFSAWTNWRRSPPNAP